VRITIRVPAHLLAGLDNLAEAQKVSRSALVRRALEDHLPQAAASQWPADLLIWMQSPPDPNDALDLPDFEEMRAQTNKNWPSLGRH
jgi:Arc/MetJ-type ribon-helix-helix transcriptional regulator